MSDRETSPVFTSLTRRFPENGRFCRISAPCSPPSDRSVTARVTPSRSVRLPAQEGKKFQPHLQDPQLGKVCAPVALAHVGQGDAHRREKTQRRLPLDLYLHPEGLRGGGLDFGLVGIDVQEEKDRKDGQYGEGCHDTKKNEDLFHRVGGRLFPMWMVYCAILKYYSRTPSFRPGSTPLVIAASGSACRNPRGSHRGETA